jgi:integrase
MIRGAWSVYWWWNGKPFSLAVGASGEEAEPAAEAVRRAISSAIAAGVEFPAPYSDARAAIRYREMRYGAASPIVGTPASSEDWLKDYARELKGECAEKWAEMSMVRLRTLNKDIGGLVSLTPEKASKYLAEIAANRKTGTRNRFLATFNRFYKWAVRTERATANPFAGIKTLKEEKTLAIVYCTPADREEIIALAQATGWKDWIAVPIAFYSGMRREEVANLEWPDVRFNEGLLIAHRTKTKKGRPVPLNAKLEALLSAIPQSQRTGHVVKTPEGVDRLLRMDNITRKIRKEKRNALLNDWDIPRPPPSRAKDYPEKKKAFEAAKKKRAATIKTAMERIGWNAFRHTFGSLLAQAGVSIDKISSWMGNTPEVCRRHYAQFIPRDRRDGEIDKL